jgi:DNA adenine methylase
VSGPVLRYPGAKWRLASWIVGHLPPHEVYVEPFLGSGAVFFSKPPSTSEVLNDLDGDVVNLFRVIRERAEELAAAVEMTPWSREEFEAARERGREGDPLERARLFLVACWQSHGQRLQRSGWRHDGARRDTAGGSGHTSVTRQWRGLPARILAVVDRLRDAQIENRPAVDILRRYADRQVLVYADPPYVAETRSDAQIYRCEMKREDHEELLAALLAHPGPVVLSGYDSPLYAEQLSTWRRVALSAVAEHGQKRVEVLWLNAAATRGQLSLGAL